MAVEIDADDLRPFNVIAVLTSGVKKVLLPKHDYIIRHMNVKDAASTPSASTDFLVVMHVKKQNGDAQTMDADRGAGEKLVIDAGMAITVRGSDLRDDPDEGPRAFQIQAVGGDAMVQIVTARDPLFR